MTLLILGLVLFLGVHSVRIVADGWRTRMQKQWGAQAWKGVYSAVSLFGFSLLCWGYAQARLDPTPLWAPPAALRHGASLLVLLAFVLLAGAYVPRNALRAHLHHPMMAGTALWALGHLLANGSMTDLLLFGSFLIWAVLGFAAAWRRDHADPQRIPAGTVQGTITTLVVGTLAFAGFAFWAHAWLLGVRPF